MPDADTLRTAGRTGCIEDVSEIVGTSGNQLGRFSFNRRLVIDQKPGAAGCKDGRERCIRQNERRRAVRDHELYSFSRISGIKGQIGRARFVNGKNCNNKIGCARQRNANDNTGSDAESRKTPGQARCALMQCGKAELLLAEYQGDRVRRAFGLSGAERGDGCFFRQCRPFRRRQNPEPVALLPLP